MSVLSGRRKMPAAAQTHGPVVCVVKDQQINGLLLILTTPRSTATSIAWNRSGDFAQIPILLSSEMTGLSNV